MEINCIYCGDSYKNTKQSSDCPHEDLKLINEIENEIKMMEELRYAMKTYKPIPANDFIFLEIIKKHLKGSIRERKE